MHVEKPSTTSAASTAFCAEKISGPSGFLWFDGNGKITAGNGTLDDPRPNAFSLVQIQDCPGATATCKASCYVHGLEKHAPDTHALYRHNSVEIRRIVGDPSIYFMWALVVADWIKNNCEGGFRWHVSGDVWSSLYAAWIARVCALTPNVGHWIYTRSFKTFFPLLDASTTTGGNLAINLSCDKDNYLEALQLSRRHGLRLCYLTSKGELPNTLRKDDVIFPDYSLRGGTADGQVWFGQLPSLYKSLVCPVDYHGKSERRRCGPCDRCIR